MAKFDEGDLVEVISTPNGAYVGEQHEIVHVGEDAAGDEVYILRVDLAEPYKTLDISEGKDGKSEASFYAEQLEEV